MKQILEISTEGMYVSAKRGLFYVSHKNETQGSIPIDDISVLLITARGASFSKEALVRLNESGGVCVLCGKNYAPSSFVIPKNYHHDTANRIDLQISISEPLKKQLWKSFVKAKIKNQALVLSLFNNEKVSLLYALSNSVLSGDTSNREAVAARVYWRSLFGENFRRNVDEKGINSLLNYGYGVLRSIVARAVCCSGLEPSLGIHHHNKKNFLSLVDDCMEPFRPIIDFTVKKISLTGNIEMSTDNKKKLIDLSWLDLMTEKGNSCLINSIQYMINSLVLSYKVKKNVIEIPGLPKREILQEL